MCEPLNCAIHGIEIQLFCFKINYQIMENESCLLTHIHTHIIILTITVLGKSLHTLGPLHCSDLPSILRPGHKLASSPVSTTPNHQNNKTQHRLANFKLTLMSQKELGSTLPHCCAKRAVSYRQFEVTSGSFTQAYLSENLTH